MAAEHASARSAALTNAANRMENILSRRMIWGSAHTNEDESFKSGVNLAIGDIPHGKGVNALGKIYAYV